MNNLRPNPRPTESDSIFCHLCARWSLRSTNLYLSLLYSISWLLPLCLDRWLVSLHLKDAFLPPRVLLFSLFSSSLNFSRVLFSPSVCFLTSYSCLNPLLSCFSLECFAAAAFVKVPSEPLIAKSSVSFSLRFASVAFNSICTISWLCLQVSGVSCFFPIPSVSIWNSSLWSVWAHFYCDISPCASSTHMVSAVT